MSRVELTGWIPVTVVVDTDEPEVVAIHAWDEEFRYGDPPTSAIEAIETALAVVHGGDEYEAALAQVRQFKDWQPQDDDEKLALEIAEDNMWPAWEWGA